MQMFPPTKEPNHRFTIKPIIAPSEFLSKRECSRRYLCILGACASSVTVLRAPKGRGVLERGARDQMTKEGLARVSILNLSVTCPCSQPLGVE